MRIRLIGKRTYTGIGVHYTNFANALKQVEYWGNCVEEIDFEDQSALTAAMDRSDSTDINICFVGMDLQGYFRGTNIQWIVFESTRVPSIIMKVMLTADQIWVPSTWGKHTLIANGIGADRCHVMHEGVDPNQYHPYYASTDCSTFKFLFSGKAEKRKSIGELLHAWQQEFGNDSGVELTIKTHYFIDPNNPHHSEIADWIQHNNMRNIKLLDHITTDQDMIALYQQSHVFVLPTKGEGWGLPLIEAAAMAMPIVTTMHSGQTEFLQTIRSSVIPVEFSMTEIDCPMYQWCYPDQLDGWGQWAQPNVTSLQQGLRLAKQNYTALKAQAQRNSQPIRRDFSWTVSADRALALLQAQGLLVKK